jgi:MFS family permease
MRFFRNRGSGAMFLIMEGIVYTTAFYLYNPFIQMFSKRMGGGNIHTALLNALPPLAAAFTLIPFGILIERINRKKQTIAVLLGVLSLFFAAVSFVPVIPGATKVIIYVALIGLMNCPVSLYVATWQSFFAENFKGSFANRIYTLRSKYSTLFGLVTVLTAGLILTNIPSSDAHRISFYRSFYAICFALTLLQIFFFSKVRERRAPNSADASDMAQVSDNADASDMAQVSDNADASDMAQVSDNADASDMAQVSDNAVASDTAQAPGELKPFFKISKGDFAGILTDKPFIIFCICGFAYHFVWQMAWPVLFIYNTDYARLNELQLSMINFLQGLAQFFSFSLWGKLIEKKGSSMAIIIGAAGIAATMLAFTTLISYPMILVVNIFSGIFLAGFNLSLFLNLLEILPQDKKTVYISIFNTITSITGFAAPLAGIRIYELTSVYFTLGLAGILRFAATGLYLLRWLNARNQAKREQGMESRPTG